MHWAESLIVLWDSQILNLKIPGVHTRDSGNLPSLSIPHYHAHFSPSSGRQVRSGYIQVSVTLEGTYRSVAPGGKKKPEGLSGLLQKILPSSLMLSWLRVSLPVAPSLLLLLTRAPSSLCS